MLIIRSKGSRKPVNRIVVAMRDEGFGIHVARVFNKKDMEFVHVLIKLDFLHGPIVNWGCSRIPLEIQGPIPVIKNHPTMVGYAIDKVQTYKRLEEEGVPIPEYTTDRAIAEEWYAEGFTVYCRTLVKGARGNGIIVVEPPADFVDAPLYTKAFPTTHEFRVHVFGGEVVDYVQKKKKRNADANLFVRNHHRGWVMAHSDIIVRKKIKELAVNAVSSLGLHFGAVDVLANFDPPIEGKWQFVHAVVCEVNTAPGLSSPLTLKAYVKAFKEMLQ